MTTEYWLHNSCYQLSGSRYLRCKLKLWPDSWYLKHLLFIGDSHEIIGRVDPKIIKSIFCVKFVFEFYDDSV